MALRMKTGKSFGRTSSRPEASPRPIAWGNSVYFGDQAGHVYDLGARDGHVNWKFSASGAVKGGPALAGNRLYFGDYAGRAYALNASTGRRIWAVNTTAPTSGSARGTSTPRRRWPSAACTWGTPTAACIRSPRAPASWPGPRRPAPTSTRRPPWPTSPVLAQPSTWALRRQPVRLQRPLRGDPVEAQLAGPISGSATVVGGIVYYSDLGTKKTTGLDAGPDRQVFFFTDGAVQWRGLRLHTPSTCADRLSCTSCFPSAPRRLEAYAAPKHPKASAGKRRR